MQCNSEQCKRKRIHRATYAKYSAAQTLESLCKTTKITIELTNKTKITLDKGLQNYKIADKLRKDGALFKKNSNEQNVEVYIKSIKEEKSFFSCLSRSKIQPAKLTKAKNEINTALNQQSR